MITHSIVLMMILGLGIILGFLYFGGLWLTVRKLPRVKKPVVLVCISYLLRLGGTLGIFHLILQQSDQHQILALLLVSFMGFLLSRNFLISQIIPREL